MKEIDVNVEKGVCDREELLDFANMIFSMSAESTDFEKLLPKAYQEDSFKCLEHFYIKEEGRLKALIDVKPENLKLGNDILKTAYIGTVSVHPKSRKKGYMIQLMEAVERELTNQDIDLLILDGKRHRYRHFGFEKAGRKYCFDLTLHGLGNNKDKAATANQYTYTLLSDESSQVKDICYQLYQRRNVIYRERKAFEIILQSWEAQTYVVWREDTCIGYLNLSADERNLYEFELADNSLLTDIIYNFMLELGLDEIGVEVGADELEKCEKLQKIADYYIMSMSHQIKILKYDRVLEFLLKWKSKYTKLTPATCCIGIKRSTDIEKYIIEVKVDCQNQTQIICMRDVSKRKPDIVFEDDMELVNILTTARWYQEEEKPVTVLHDMPKNWFPLPFFLPEADAF